MASLSFLSVVAAYCCAIFLVRLHKERKPCYLLRQKPERRNSSTFFSQDITLSLQSVNWLRAEAPVLQYNKLSFSFTMLMIMLYCWLIVTALSLLSSRKYIPAVLVSSYKRVVRIFNVDSNH